MSENALAVAVQEALPDIIDELALERPEVFAGQDDIISIFKGDDFSLALLLCDVTLAFATEG